MAAPLYQNPIVWSVKLVKWLSIAFVALIVVVIVVQASLAIVEPGERGILIQLGNIKGVFDPGLHLKLPFIQNVVSLDVRTQKSEVQVDAASKDLQSIHTLVALNYHVDPTKVDSLYQQIGTEYETRIIDPAIQESVKAATATFTAEELITKRPTVKDEIKNKLSARLSTSFIDIDDFSIVDFQFSESFNVAIEAKQTAVQEALKAENDLRRIEIEAKQQIETAKAQAESIRIQGEALKENQGLVQLKLAEKWNGVMPLYVMGDSIPLINLMGKAQ
jgi:regulator of protease activity HflC (stomatin/prohibitin superfamily)